MASLTGKTLRVKEVTGDLFDAPDGSVLIQACNCKGSWGAGIAKAFHTKFPKAFEVYRRHCQEGRAKLLGTALLIEPTGASAEARNLFIGNLFTSVSFGRNKNEPAEILASTETAMKDLLKQVAKHAKGGGKISELRMCRINAGLFAVPWEDTRKILETIDVSDCPIDTVTVVSPPP